MNGPTNFAEPVKRLIAVIIDGIILGVGAAIIGAFTFIPTVMSLVALGEDASEEELVTAVAGSVGVIFLFIILYYAAYFLYFALQHKC